MELVNVPREFSSRYLNEGFSGGEKKRLEILQLALQKPKLAVLDETDSGLDIDALNVVAHGVNTVATGNDMGVLIITHYQRILHMVTPTRVSIMFDGRIATQGGPELVDRLEAEGYAQIREEVSAAHVSTLADTPLADGLPLAAARGDRLHGLGGDVADAAGGHRRDGRLLRAPSRHRAPQRLRPRGRGDGAVRGRARPDRRVRELARRLHDLHEERDRGAQPRRLLVGAREPRTRRPRRHDPARASLELRALARAVPRDRRAVRDGRGRRRVRAPARPARRAARDRHGQARRRRPRLQRRRHDQPGRRDHRARPRRRRDRRRRRLAGRPAAGGRPRASSTPTSTPGPATSSTARPGSASCTGARSCSTRCRRSSAVAT